MGKSATNSFWGRWLNGMLNVIIRWIIGIVVVTALVVSVLWFLICRN